VLASVGQVRTVKVTGRILTVSMAPGALAMTNQGMRGGDNAPSSGSKYRLTSIESWRKPRFTEDGRIQSFKDTRNPPRLIENKGRDRAGKTVTDGSSTLHFDRDGFPEFKTKFELLLDDVHIGSGNARAHLRACNERLFRAIEKDSSLAKELGLSRDAVDELLHSPPTPPAGYTWHHHQDVGRMQLVPLSEHALSISHTGGMAIWGGGYPR
jgi:hypothetical protein